MCEVKIGRSVPDPFGFVASVRFRLDHSLLLGVREENSQ